MPDWTSLLQQPNQIKPLTLQDVYDPNGQLRNMLAVASLLDQRENAVRRNRLLDMAIKQKQDEETANKLNLIGTQGASSMGNSNMPNPGATTQTPAPALQTAPLGRYMFLPENLGFPLSPGPLEQPSGPRSSTPAPGPSMPQQGTPEWYIAFGRARGEQAMRNPDPSQLPVEGRTIAVHLPNRQTVKFLKDDKGQGKSGGSISLASGSWEELKKKKGW